MVIYINVYTSICDCIFITSVIIGSEFTSTDELVDAAFYKSVEPPLDLRVIRGVDDEAAMVLTLGSIGVRLNTATISLVGLLVHPVTYVCYAFSFLFLGILFFFPQITRSSFENELLKPVVFMV